MDMNKKIVITIICVMLLFISLPIINCMAVDYSSEDLELKRDAELVDDKGKKLGIELNAGQKLSVLMENVNINYIEYKQTLFQANSALIKRTNCENNSDSFFSITNEASNLYDYNGNVIGKIDANVEIDALYYDDTYFIIDIDGFIDANAFENTANIDVNNNELEIIGLNFLDIIINIIKLLFGNLTNSLNNIIR